MSQKEECCEKCFVAETDGIGGVFSGCIKEDCHCHSQKESEWEKEFEMKMASYHPVGFWKNERDPDIELIKAFIKELLSNREKEIAEEVRKIKTAGHDECNDDFLMNVLQILKH